MFPTPCLLLTEIHSLYPKSRDPSSKLSVQTPETFPEFSLPGTTVGHKFEEPFWLFELFLSHQAGLPITLEDQGTLYPSPSRATDTHPLDLNRWDSSSCLSPRQVSVGVGGRAVRRPAGADSSPRCLHFFCKCCLKYDVGLVICLWVALTILDALIQALTTLFSMLESGCGGRLGGGMLICFLPCREVLF